MSGSAALQLVGSSLPFVQTKTASVPALGPRPGLGNRRRTRIQPRAGASSPPSTPFDFDDLMTSELREMRETQAQMDAEFDRILRESDRMMRDAEERLRSAPSGTVRIERSEEGFGRSYRQTIEISSVGGGWPASTLHPGGGLPLGIIAASAAACVYAVGAWLFSRGFWRTSFKEGGRRWQLTALWPALLMASGKFRKQFAVALRAGGPEEEAPEAGGKADGEERSERFRK